MKRSDIKTLAVKTTPELVEGDIVVAYGMMLRVNEVKSRTLRDHSFDKHNYDRLTADGFEPKVVWSECTILNVDEVNEDGQVPAGWRRGDVWTVQGNAYAKWAVADEMA